jgi:competence protein ComEC
MLLDSLLAQRGHLLHWVPVAMGLGIAVYFHLRVEPEPVHWVGVGLAALVFMGLSWRAGPAVAPLLAALWVACFGAGIAGVRTHLVAEPVLGFRYYGPIEGRVRDVDRSASDAVRLTLDRVVLEDLRPERTPARVRVSLHGTQDWIDPEPGQVVILAGHLSPPSGPVEPGDFDFRRMAWFDRLGAVGYTRTPVLLLHPAEEGRTGLWVHRARLALSERIQTDIPGDAGGYAAAVMTGDRAGLSIAANDAMRDANLYHLVSISGMHMGMLVGFVLVLVRSAVALVPWLALRVSSKKIAAGCALPVAAFYLALAGRDVATERAFIMVAVMLVAVLLDRQALTMRSVAVAAMIVLLLRPETLLNPGFQMSFAAVMALVAGFQAIRGPQARVAGVWRWLLPTGLLIFSSLLAGLATAPFAAAHFNRVAHYGLIANLLAVPAMGILVMPGAVIYALLAPFGLDAPAAWVIGLGSKWILWVSQTIAGWDGAVSAVITPQGAVLPLIALGGLFVLLWQGRSRWAGVVPVVAALVLWTGATRPVLLVADSGGLMGWMQGDGRHLSRPTGDGFAAESWLENDGSVLTQAEAPGFAEEGRRFEAKIGETVVIGVRGQTELAALEGCGGAAILIVNVVDETARPCEVYDLRRLRQTGALAITPLDGAVKVVTVREVAGLRPWTGGQGTVGQ